ncbi:TetR family transcriptional regulator [Arsukibacterium ikkense]|uniref:TetR family transcriptional regulator n=1 Tax=Arsukibacterium ikkense TaxID=336831 RepID=A0A0M2V4Q2_9GAMM|nr:TetR/AcrR family transcriptional regulator [Arsukibacterium ikkense]KKO45611.1 TetR family transcriptional regulator [Arsukibacterium ikkense]
MGTSERKQRERDEREQLFLDTAEQMIASDGIIQLQMAKLAKACDYATGTLYQHFTSREDLLVALAARHSAQHLQMFQQIIALPVSSRDKMFAISVAERDFRKHNPTHAKLSQYIFTEAVWENASACRREQVLQCGQPIAALVCGIVQQAIDDGSLVANGCSAMELAIAPWALCQGSHTLEQTSGLLEAFAVPRHDMQQYRHMHMLLNGMGWQPLVDVSDMAQIKTRVAALSVLLNI